MKKSFDENSISLAPRFSRHKIYFTKLHNFFHKWSNQELRKTVRYYGKERVSKVLSSEFPPSEEEEKAVEQRLKGRELNRYKNENIKSLMCLLDLQQTADHHIAFYYSFFIYLFSDFENILNQLCREYGKKTNSKVTFLDLKGSGIERSLLFLEKITAIKLPDESLVNEVILMRDIRNIIVHSSGYTSDLPLIKRIQTVKYIILKGRENGEIDRVFFKEEYLKYCIDKMQKFFNQLVKNNPKVFYRIFK